MFQFCTSSTIYIYSWKRKLYATLETRVSRYTAPSEMLLTLSLLVRRRISLRVCKLRIITKFGITHQTKRERIPSFHSINLERSETNRLCSANNSNSLGVLLIENKRDYFPRELSNSQVLNGYFYSSNECQDDIFFLENI